MATASELLEQAAELAQRAASLAGQGLLEEAVAAQKDADQAMRSAKRALANAGRGRKAAAPRSQPDRELVVAALGELEVPVSPKLVGDYAFARFGTPLRASAFASIRRDERRAWASPRSARAVYIAPALDAGRLTPLRGLVTLSDWELHRRLVGPRSARVDYLRATRSVARHLSWTEDRGGAGDGLARLMGEFARTLPIDGAGWSTPNPADVVAAVDAELELLEESDTRFRTEAAERALRQLDDEQRLWGAKPLGALPKVKGA